LALGRGGKYHASGVSPTTNIAAEVRARLQLESHTCGYLALSSIYEAFGMDERKADLRFRIGVDQSATLLSDDSSMGTLHPDILRVASQDGFAPVFVPPESEEAATRIAAHLERHLPALVLITRRENDHLHWIVLSGHSNGMVTVADSLRPEEPYRENLSEFLDECVVSVVLMSPRESGVTAPSVNDLHTAGLEEMARVFRLLKKRGKPAL
jgi:ABC-type bacteriocin/lantibiotic exporter with double-glycine peptidase domain